MTRSLLLALMLAASTAAASLGQTATAARVLVSGVDVPPPKRLKTTPPVYPPEAQARGIRGIVILEIVIDTTGKVSSAQLVRSIEGLDEAALTAVRKWEYEITTVNGEPVAVRHTVPITFSMELPEIERPEGVPELRAGVVPRLPEGVPGSGRTEVRAELTIEPDGSVSNARVTEGQPPFSEALLRALGTWRFAPDPGRATVSCALIASFDLEAGKDPPGVALRLESPQWNEAVASADHPSLAAASSTPAPEVEPPGAAPAGATPPPAPPAQKPAQDSSPPRPAPPAPAPPVEVISQPPAVAPAAEQGFSSVRDVTLGAGVPDLVKGRRPVVPPVARIQGADGNVCVDFTIDAAGQTSVLRVDGTELLKTAAQQAVQSWTFRRTSPERLALTAEFIYKDGAATATVRPTS